MGTLDIVLLGSFVLCFFIQMFYMLYFYAKPLFFRNKINKGEIAVGEELPGVSVVISAKNESENLEKFLPMVLEQDYPNFEVIVVNDGSTDESENVLGRFEQQYKNLYKTYIPEEAKYVSRKKLALTVGIKAARNEVLLFTEASSEPLSKNWIRSMARHFDQNTEIVLGFGIFNQKGFFSRMANYDNLLLGLKYLAKAISKQPYMGIGTNLAYRKELFFAKKGFSKRLNLRAGDDDLFVNEAATKTNTKVEISENSIIQTNIDSFKIWQEMKVSHAATKRYYKGNEVGLWRFEYFTRYLFLSLAIAISIFYFQDYYITGATLFLFIIRYLTLFLVVNKSAKIFQINKFYFTFLLFDFLQPILNCWFDLNRMMRGKHDYTWK